jgi:predicted amidohydrolase YtcJ
MRIIMLSLIILLSCSLVFSGCGQRTARSIQPAISNAPATAASSATAPITPYSSNIPIKTTPTATSPASSTASPTTAPITTHSSNIPPLTTAAADGKADIVLENGRVLTVDSQNRIAEAVAVKGDKIIKVGPTAEMHSLVGPNTRVIDLAGKVLTPGIIDAHFHLMSYGRQVWPGFVNIRYPAVQTLDDLLKAVAERARTTPAGEWIAGNQGFHVGESTTFDRYTIDKAAPNNPVYLRNSSGQYSVVNSLALKLAGIDKHTPDPFGGKIVRNPATGEPTGVLLHYPAENLVLKLAPGYGVLTDAQMEEDVLNAQKLCLESGITSVQDVIVSTPGVIKNYMNVADKNQLKVRTYLLLYINTEEQAKQYAAAIKGFKTDRLTMAGWKLAIDGGFSAGTCLMYDKSLPAAKNAYFYYEPDQLKRIVKLLHNTGLQVAFHIVGDRGTDEALDAVEAAIQANPRKDPRFRIEHMCFVQPASLRRIKEMGVIVSTQPQWITWNGDDFRYFTSETEMQHFIPLKTILNNGIPLAFGCDAPAALAHEPNWAFVGAESRRTMKGFIANAAESLTPMEVLRIHTLGSAYAAFEEGIKGSIETGKLADLVVWSQDITSTDYQTVMGAKALITMVGGKVEFER